MKKRLKRHFVHFYTKSLLKESFHGLKSKYNKYNRISLVVGGGEFPYSEDGTPHPYSVPFGQNEWLAHRHDWKYYRPHLYLRAVKITRFSWDLHIHLRNHHSNLQNTSIRHRSSNCLLEHHSHPRDIVHNRISLENSTYYQRDLLLVWSNKVIKNDIKW